MRPISEIIIHCSATRQDWMAGQAMADKVNEIRRWHMRDRGWKDIGYHYLIDRNGTVATGRPVEKVGAHVQGHNTGTIGVCLIGGHGSSETDRFDQHFTPHQDKALRTLLADLKRKHKGVAKISGHNQYAAKACPGFEVPDWLTAKPVAVSAEPISGIKPAPLTRPTSRLRDAVAQLDAKQPAPAPQAPPAVSTPPKPATGLWAAILALFKRT